MHYNHRKVNYTAPEKKKDLRMGMHLKHVPIAAACRLRQSDGLRGGPQKVRVFVSPDELSSMLTQFG